ncbi:MAG: hypothetical protein ACREUC_13265 [Steroidobacteraceae bacterium]
MKLLITDLCWWYEVVRAGVIGAIAVAVLWGLTGFIVRDKKP